MNYYNDKDKHLFMNYNKEEYEEIKKDIRNNCTRCINYKEGNCILIKIPVSALYVCPNFKVKGE